MATQIKLRRGTYLEHENFIGAEGEVTVETTSNTLVVHDGITRGGYPLTTLDEHLQFKRDIIREVEGIQTNISQAHNHDDRYAKIVHSHEGVYANNVHTHDDRYLKQLPGVTNVYCKIINGYSGLSNGDADDGGWFRTSRLGLLPYQAGGYSNLGTSSWRFSEGWFNLINATGITVAKNGTTSSIDFPSNGNDPGFIRHVESPTDTAGLYFSVSDNFDEVDKFYFGGSPGGQFRSGSSITSDGLLWLNKGLTQNNATINVAGMQIYFDGRRPADAPEGSISFG